MKKFSIFIILVSFFMGCGDFLTNSPSKVVKDYNQAVAKGDLVLACGMISGEGKELVCDEKGEPTELFQWSVGMLKEMGGIKDIKIISQKVLGEIATVKHQTTLGNGQKIEDSTTLIKENGKWKLQSKKPE